MQKLFLWCFILIVGGVAKADFFCAYKCDAEKGNYDAQAVLSGDSTTPECIVECSIAKISPYYCTFLAELSLSTLPPGTLQSLAKNIMGMPKSKNLPISAENNKLYSVLRNFDTKQCVQHIKLMSLKLNATSADEINQNLNILLTDFKNSFEEKYSQFREYQHVKKHNEKTSVLNLENVRGLFDWCQNYCTIIRVPKTYRALENFVGNNICLNASDLRDKIKDHKLMFSHSKNKYLTRSYKCLSQCSLEKTNDYFCYLLDTIDIKNDETETSRKILNLVAQIMLKSLVKPGNPKSRLTEYLNNETYHRDCLNKLGKYFYRGRNYSENISHLKFVYGNG